MLKCLPRWCTYLMFLALLCPGLAKIIRSCRTIITGLRSKEIYLLSRMHVKCILIYPELGIHVLCSRCDYCLPILQMTCTPNLNPV